MDELLTLGGRRFFNFYFLCENNMLKIMESEPNSHPPAIISFVLQRQHPVKVRKRKIKFTISTIQFFIHITGINLTIHFLKYFSQMFTHSCGGSVKLKPWLYITIRFWFRASFCVETKLSWMPKQSVLTEHVCLGSLIDVD